MEAMSVSVSNGPAIVAGYEYRLQLEADSPVFPAGCALAAQVHAKVSDSAVIATLSTGNGGLARISDTVVEITIPPAAKKSGSFQLQYAPGFTTDTTDPFDPFNPLNSGNLSGQFQWNLANSLKAIQELREAPALPRQVQTS